MTVIVDYGMGNLASVLNAFHKIGEKDVVISSDPVMISGAERLVLPGVGAFEDAMRNLERGKLSQPIRDFAASGRPFMGICLGLQLLFDKSHENGVYEGLGVLAGEVVRFQIGLPVPHMGWNQVVLRKQSVLFDDIHENAYFYFDHAYYAVPKDISLTAMETEYEKAFTSAVLYKNIVALQFHPEKSHQNGLQIVKRFSQWDGK